MNVIDYTPVPSPRQYNTYNNVKAWLTMRSSAVSGSWSRMSPQAMSGAGPPDLQGPESPAAAAKTASGSIAIFAQLKQRSNLGQEVSVSFGSGVIVPSVED